MDPERQPPRPPSTEPPRDPLPQRGPDGLLPEDFRFTAPAVTVPKGGGAIGGMGEKLSANPATGTATLALPLPLSPGRGGKAPELTLTYDSGAPNGPFGLGWQLSLPAVRRKTSRGLPRYRDEGPDADVFVMSDTEDLVPLLRLDAARQVWERVPDRSEVLDGEVWAVRRYRPRTEGGFARIERWTRGSDGDVHWRTTSSANVRRIYGRTPSARVADPADPRRVFEWLIEEERTETGEVVAWRYRAEDGAGTEGQPWEERRAAAYAHLDRVSWGNTAMGCHPDLGEGGEWLFHLVFDYGAHDEEDPGLDGSGTWSLREDPFSSFRAGFDIRCRRLCRRVLMVHRFAELRDDGAGTAVPVVVRSLELTHHTRPTVTTLAAARTRGWAWTAAGYEHLDDAALQLSYVEPVIGSAVRFVEGLEELAGGRDLQQWRFVDLDGEGVAGLLTEQGDTWFYKRNEGEGRFAPARALGRRPDLALAGPGVQLRDVDGDGRLEAVVLRSGVAGSYARTTDGGWEGFRSLRRVPVPGLDDPDARLVDLDGDGIADLLRTEGDRFVWHRCEARDGFGEGERAPMAHAQDDGPRFLFSRDGAEYHLADMVGDGLQDVVRIRDGAVHYWPNLGYGRFGPRVHMAGAPRFDHPDRYDPARLRLADVDGSGPTDLIYLGPDGVRVWFNQAGNGFSAPVEVPFPAVASPAEIQVSDLLGTGTACLVWSSPLISEAARPLRYVELMAGGKPWLLSTVRNGRGRETRLMYTPSTAFYLADRRDGRPWATRLPFPVQCLTRVEQLDHVTGWRFVTESAYHHGTFDGAEREFRGFGMVETWDTERFSDYDDPDRADAALVHTVPPIRTRTWLHTGGWETHRSLLQAYRAEFWAGDATVLPEPVVPEGREAARALRGRPLRVEVYADDADPDDAASVARAALPYTVTETTWEVRELQPADGHAHAVHHVVPGPSRTVTWDRVADDPRVSVSTPTRIDAYGTVTRSFAVAYPRRAARGPTAEQAATHVVVTEQDVHHQDADGAPAYHLAVPVRTRAWELSGPSGDDASPFGADELEQLFAAAIEIPSEERPGAGVQKRLLTEQITEYWNDGADAPLRLAPFGTDELQRVALPRRRWQRAFTPGMLARLTDIGPAELSAAGYEDLLGDGHRWVGSGVREHDPAAFYVVTAVTDPFGNTTRIAHDTYQLAPVEVTDPVGNTVSATLDYRALAPARTTDANGHARRAAFDAQGRVVATWWEGRDGEGDTADDPTERFAYDPLAWEDREEPVSAHRWARRLHVHVEPDPTVAGHEQERVYADGGGNVVQQLVRAADGDVPVPHENGSLSWEPSADRWIGTGRTVVDNKGHVVRRYEPFFKEGPGYETEKRLVQWGVSPVFHYDPPGRLVRTDFPDGTVARVAFDPWRTRSHDANDTAADSRWYAERTALPPDDPDRAAALSTDPHHDTPTTTHLDTLGRAYQTDADSGGALFTTHLTLDVQGSPLVVTDALGHRTQEQDVDQLGRPLATRTLDAGDTLVLLDAAGQPAWTWRSGGLRTRVTSDALRRPIRLEVDEGSGWRTHQLVVFGDAIDEPTLVRDANLRGRPWRVYDGAGRVVTTDHDFKGNALRTERAVLADVDREVDWSALVGLDTAAALDAADGSSLAETWATGLVVDALDRPVEQTAPDGALTTTTYDEGGRVRTIGVTLPGGVVAQPVVADVTYDAKGRRLSVDRGNGTRTTYTYDPVDQRLTELRTVRTSAPDAPLQLLTYHYDAVGNLTQITDAAQQTHFFANAALTATQTFRYDPLYRLIEATGREKTGAPAPGWGGMSAGSVPDATEVLQAYTQRYAYDAVGNLTEVRSPFGATPWTRTYALDPASNRLLSTTVGGVTYPCTTNVRGALTSMAHLPTMVRQYDDQLRAVDFGNGDDAVYHYDAAGRRVRKIVRRGSRIEDTIQLEGWERYEKRGAASGVVDTATTTLHVMDAGSRVCLVETVTERSGPLPAQPVVFRFQLGNHQESAALELDERGRIISYEEFHPYGTTSWWAADAAIEVSAKRYRYTGMERDEETGLGHHGARYYAAWLGRWDRPDPIGLKSGTNRFSYLSDAPSIGRDPSGLATEQELARLVAQQAARRGEETITRIVAEQSVQHGSTIAEGMALGEGTGTAATGVASYSAGAAMGWGALAGLVIYGGLVVVDDAAALPVLDGTFSTSGSGWKQLFDYTYENGLDAGWTVLGQATDSLVSDSVAGWSAFGRYGAEHGALAAIDVAFFEGTPVPVAPPGTLERDVGLVLNEQIAGGVPSGYAGHHIISIHVARDYGVAVRAAELGYNINRSSNGIALPTTLEEAISSGLTLHSGRHLSARHEGSADQLLHSLFGDLQARYDAGEVDDSELLDAMTTIEDTVRLAIEENAVRLQSADPHWQPR
ncbi:MAG: AHH domain-containing protein [Alphaproteobacteria bacterium]|nr:AHH domain-containing protein [Alphaproteobacteria bacterium]MCB9695712.1 AHH domain-containing protein [Alphaproteobacteria bacterium]